MTAVRLPALSSTSPKLGTEKALLLDGISKTKRRPMIPVIHNAKARNVASKDFESSERCFYALSHRGGNPLDSEFHMQARLGFRRPRNRALRLRPLEELPARPSPGPPTYPRSGRHRHRSQGSHHGSRQASRDGRLRSGGPKKPSSRMGSKVPAVSLDEVEEILYAPEADKQSQAIAGSAMQDARPSSTRTVGSTKTVGSPEPFIALDHDIFEFDELVGEVAASLTSQIVSCVRDISKSPTSLISQSGKEDGLPDLNASSQDDTAKLTKIQAGARGMLVRKKTADVSAKHEALSAEQDGLLDLSAFSQDDTAKLTKIQAGARGMLVRKKTADVSAKHEALSAEQDGLLDLSAFSQDDTAKLTKIQAGARGMLVRKKTADVSAKHEALPAEQDGLLDLSVFSQDDTAKLTKIQAGARGMLVRKKTADVSAKHEALPAEQDGLLDLSAFSQDDTAKLTKIQAGARGMLARKKNHDLQETAAVASLDEEDEYAAALTSSRRMLGKLCTKILAKVALAEEKATR